ncbi:HD domain-containing phosphohydrolase [Desulfogranum mediterraneum]|uniref:HD domain-containing phosphohydrolase n=1 Tax=Desulfogranum mediterraneum TaxID=160661 RepID=UPI0003F8C786|nr:HD domain-containing phosphohydrolase [Desulfogranum mediterraneum]
MAWDQERYLTELRELHHRRVYLILFLGLAMMVGFSLLDYIIAPSYFFLFLGYRALACCLGMVLLLANYYDRRRRWFRELGLLAYILAGLVALLMIRKMGGSLSPYYVGLIVVMTIYTALAPLTPLQTLGSGFLLISAYLLTVLNGFGGESAEFSEVFSNFFFLFCFSCIAATQSHTETSGRKEELRLRLEKEQAAQALEQEALRLEEEVRRRTAQQRRSEQRYQVLFNSLVDDVVLVNPQGVLLRANEAFLRHFGRGVIDGHRTLFALLPPESQGDLREALQGMLKGEEECAPCQLPLLHQGGQRMFMEIKGAVLRRRQEVVGVQLILRDIQVRLQLEKVLLRSLETIRQTEEAAILALAKLAEYREGRSGRHLERIREYCRILASQLARDSVYGRQLSPGFVKDLYQASILHDIGKVAVPDTLLRKSTPLTELERDTIRQHTVAGGEVIKEMEAEGHGSSFLTIAKKIACFHHEDWDGLGYPHGLSGEDIPLEARILAVAYAYEVRTAGKKDDREAYRATLEWLQQASGSRFDPVIIRALMACEQEMAQYQESGDETEQGVAFPGKPQRSG